MGHVIRIIGARGSFAGLAVIACLVLCPLARAERAAAAEPVAVVQPPSLWQHMLRSNGALFGPLLLLDALALAILGVTLAASMRRAAASRALLPQLTAAADSGGVERLAELSRADRSWLGQAVTAGAARLPLGIEEARHAVTVALQRLQAPRERLLRWLGALGLVSPLLGLLGTLLGTMLMCMAVSQSGGAPSGSMMITGLGHALSVLLEGVFLALLALLAYVAFRNRLQRVALATGSAADELLTRVHFRAR